MGKTAQQQKIYDRMSKDLPINSVVAPAIVKDSAGDHIQVVRSLRDDPLAGMKARGQIDEAQYLAGRDWQMYQEHSEIGGVRAIDFTRDAVDGGRFKEPDITRMSVALAELKAGRALLGEYGASIVEDVLMRRRTIVEIANARMMPRQREIDYLGRRFRECLESLAKHWGYAG